MNPEEMYKLLGMKTAVFEDIGFVEELLEQEAREVANPFLIWCSFKVLIRPDSMTRLDSMVSKSHCKE